MFFSELYSVYYNTVAAILQKAVEKPLFSDEIFSLVEKNAFGESLLSIPDNI